MKKQTQLVKSLLLPFGCLLIIIVLFSSSSFRPQNNIIYIKGTVQDSKTGLELKSIVVKKYDSKEKLAAKERSARSFSKPDFKLQHLIPPPKEVQANSVLSLGKVHFDDVQITFYDSKGKYKSKTLSLTDKDFPLVDDAIDIGTIKLEPKK